VSGVPAGNPLALFPPEMRRMVERGLTDDERARWEMLLPRLRRQAADGHTILEAATGDDAFTPADVAELEQDVAAVDEALLVIETALR
jgi:hypothetical protein